MPIELITVNKQQITWEADGKSYSMFDYQGYLFEEIISTFTMDELTIDCYIGDEMDSYVVDDETLSEHTEFIYQYLERNRSKWWMYEEFEDSSTKPNWTIFKHNGKFYFRTEDIELEITAYEYNELQIKRQWI
mgnify:FL=1